MSRGHLAMTYLFMQGLSGILWWVLLLTSESVRDLFFVGFGGWESGRSLVAADLAVFAGGSILAAYLSSLKKRWAGPVVWASVGGTVYATLVALGWVVDGIGRPIGLAAMAISLVFTCFAALALDGELRPTAADPA